MEQGQAENEANKIEGKRNGHSSAGGTSRKILSLKIAACCKDHSPCWVCCSLKVAWRKCFLTLPDRGRRSLCNNADFCWFDFITHRIHVWYIYIYGNIYHQYTPVMLAYIPAPWILWVTESCCFTIPLLFFFKKKTSLSGSIPIRFGNRETSSQVQESTRHSPWAEDDLLLGDCTSAREKLPVSSLNLWTFWDTPKFHGLSPYISI